MDKRSIITVTNGSLRGLLCIHRYRFLTGSRFPRISGFSLYHAREILRRFADRGLLGYFGFTGILRDRAKPPKYTFSPKKASSFSSRSASVPRNCRNSRVSTRMSPGRRKCITGSPLIDLFTALEASLKDKSAIMLPHTFLEYRRVLKTQARETTDYVGETETPLDRIVPDGAFILENAENGPTGLFLLRWTWARSGLHESKALTRGRPFLANSSSLRRPVSHVRPLCPHL